MATQVSLNSGAVASAGALAIQTNGTTQAVSISTGQVATLAQNPILTSGTANGVAYLDGSKVLTTGSALVFDGSVLSAPNLQGPTFSAYRGTSSQSISNATYTKVQINTEEFDTASCFDPTTNFRFTPTTAGYYQVSGSVNYDPAAAGKFFCTIYKNGTNYKSGTAVPFVATQFLGAGVSALVYLNGSTDYVELYTFQSSGGALTMYDSQTFTYFQAVMVRS